MWWMLRLLCGGRACDLKGEGVGSGLLLLFGKRVCFEAEAEAGIAAYCCLSCCLLAVGELVSSRSLS